MFSGRFWWTLTLRRIAYRTQRTSPWREHFRGSNEVRESIWTASDCRKQQLIYRWSKMWNSHWAFKMALSAGCHFAYKDIDNGKLHSTNSLRRSEHFVLYRFTGQLFQYSVTSPEWFCAFHTIIISKFLEDLLTRSQRSPEHESRTITVQVFWSSQGSWGVNEYQAGCPY